MHPLVWEQTAKLSRYRIRTTIMTCFLICFLKGLRAVLNNLACRYFGPDFGCGRWLQRFCILPCWKNLSVIIIFRLYNPLSFTIFEVDESDSIVLPFWKPNIHYLTCPFMDFITVGASSMRQKSNSWHLFHADTPIFRVDKSGWESFQN